MRYFALYEIRNFKILIGNNKTEKIVQNASELRNGFYHHWMLWRWKFIWYVKKEQLKLQWSFQWYQPLLQVMGRKTNKKKNICKQFLRIKLTRPCVAVKWTTQLNEENIAHINSSLWFISGIIIFYVHYLHSSWNGSNVLRSLQVGGNAFNKWFPHFLHGSQNNRM